MSDKRSFECFDFQVVIFGLVFLAISTFTIFMAVGKFALNSNISNYLFLFFGFLILTITFGLFISMSTYKFSKFLIISVFVAFSLVTFMKKEDIKSWFVDKNYSNVNEAMINGNDTVIETVMYNQLLIDKKDRNVERLKEYMDNPKQYSSINLEQVMNLKLFYSSIKNNDLKMKLDDMFKDKIVTKSEYSDFQKFIAKSDLNTNDLALLSMVTK
jgi:hypothetical protein